MIQETVIFTNAINELKEKQIDEHLAQSIKEADLNWRIT
jgi:hypothetical protein